MEPPSQLSKETKAELLDRIYQGYENFEEEINVTDINILDNEYDINLVLELISDQALSRYYYADVFDTLTFTSYQRSMRLATIELPYLYMDGEEIDKVQSLQVQNDTEKKLDEIVSMLDTSMSDVEKILFLHDYLITTTQYDVRAYEIAIKDNNNFTIQGTLNAHQTMCSGYTITLYRLLEKAGISAKMVDSQEMEHTWLTVEIDNNWYHIDPTWNDTTYDEYPDTDKSIDGIALHDYFLLSDVKILIDHQQWDQLEDTTSDDLYEDNYIFNSNNSKMNYYDGYWYYTLPKNNGGYKDSKYIYYTYTYDDVITKSKIDGSDLSTIDLDCKIKQLLSNNNNMLYFFNDNGVFSYNLDTNKKTLIYTTPINNSIIEIGLIGNNLKITYQDKDYNFNYEYITV
jgi:hypothetical protein